MGYRSDLTVLIYPDSCASDEQMREKYEQLKVLMATTFKEVIDLHFYEDMTWVDAHNVLKFALNDVKWYPAYSDVQMFEKMLEAFDPDSSDDIPGYCTEFVRVGEESDDVEQRHTGGNNQYYLQVRREICCDV